MKATGIVRRIDELGRVVIPKEIRRTQRIRRGDPLEIFTTGDGEVIFKKYSPMGEVNTLAAQRTLHNAEQSLLATRLAKELNAAALYRAFGGDVSLLAAENDGADTAGNSR